MKMTVYTQTVCGECRKLEAVLKDSGIPYTEINVDNDAEAMRHIKEDLEAFGTPVVVIEKKGQEKPTVIIGYQVGKIQTALGF
ncbi:putative glutaredoxin-like protein [Bacillus phage PBC5]|nr:putative glutaredoxin-like protein [Bacillus phage PBC5]